MMFSLLTLITAVSAFAYRDGTYSCKNADQAMPDNTYEIRSIALPGTSETLPYVTITRYFRGPGEQPTTRRTVVRGIATVSEMEAPESTILSLNQLRLEFTGDEMTNCRK